MKTSTTKKVQMVKTSLKSCLFILIIISTLSFKEKTTSSSVCVEITGKISQKTKSNKNSASVYLYFRNTKIDSMKISDNKSFRFKLIKNDYYTIKIVKAGYIDRLISISTALPDGVNASPIFRFHFDTVLIEATSVTKYNKDLLDFPIALVYYNNQKGKFVYHKKYTNLIKKELKR